MKWLAGGLLSALLALVSLGSVASASVNDFRFTSFEADYYLGRDESGRSTLRTVEKLIAQFPAFDQNRGIERAIPEQYDGHTTSLRIESVTNGSGAALPYTTYESNGNEVVRIGDPDRYVQGSQQYVITYTQRDVTRLFSDTKADEFYWDVNGAEWKQPFDTVTARIHIDDHLKSRLITNQSACYWGYQGESNRCSFSSDSDGMLTASVENLRPNENMTLAIGFEQGTFKGYEPSLWERLLQLWAMTLFISSLIGFIAIFWLSIRYSRASNRSKELDPIAAEYTPPKETSLLVSSQIGDNTRAATTAQLIDLAVRHYMTIAQTKEKSLWSQAEYELEIVKSVAGLSSEERTFISSIFGSEAVGTKLQTKTLKNNYTLTSKLYKDTQALTKVIKGDYGYRAKDPTVSASFRHYGLVLLVLGLVTFSPLVLIAALVAYVSAWQLTPLTDKGLALRRYLAGLRVYITAAEKERIAMLQSPEGAEKTGVRLKGEGDKKLIKLYERVLPYAILFGEEKEWNKQLAIQYESAGSSPDWYVGHSAFSAAAFTSAMNDFSGSMNSYGTASSSSSGGSSGGGSSGGGGGGGGGGGW